MACPMKGRCDGAVDWLAHRPDVEAVRVVTEDAVDAHGVVDDVGLWRLAPLVVQ